MTDEELLFFIDRIRKMCDGNQSRISAALHTLKGILERQGGQEAKVEIIGNLQSTFAARKLSAPSTIVANMNDVNNVIADARREQRESYDAHRGCR